MGRGLSPLQTWILREVGRLGTLYYADICERYFGWPPRHPIARTGSGQLSEPWHPYFSPAQIGAKTYRSVRVTISRACRRLAERGLVEWDAGKVKRRRQKSIG